MTQNPTPPQKPRTNLSHGTYIPSPPAVALPLPESLETPPQQKESALDKAADDYAADFKQIEKHSVQGLLFYAMMRDAFRTAAAVVYNQGEDMKMRSGLLGLEDLKRICEIPDEEEKP